MYGKCTTTSLSSTMFNTQWKHCKLSVKVISFEKRMSEQKQHLVLYEEICELFFRYMPFISKNTFFNFRHRASSVM
ncbi:hypothetical protein X975_15812, partial [Stegodyphus mimosarum]